jgi:hypothetical protein
MCSSTTQEIAKKNDDRDFFRSSLVRLFGIVLPNHRSLTSLTFHLLKCRTWIELLASSLPPNRRLESFDLERCVVSPQVIAGMMFRKVQIERLYLSFCGWESDECRTLCEAVAKNPYVRKLAYYDNFEPHKGTFSKVAGPDSQLTSLFIGAKWTDGGFASLVGSLTKNVALEDLTISFIYDDESIPESIPLGLLEEMLSKHNGTLRTVTLELFDDCNAETRRNPRLEMHQERINDILKRPRPYKRDAAA